MTKVTGMIRKYRLWLLLIFEVILLSIGICKYVNDSNTLETQDFYPGDLELVNGELSEDSAFYYIDETVGDIEHYLYGPYIDLSMGSYRVTVNYEANPSSSESFFWVYSADEMEGSILVDTTSLPADSTSVSLNVFLTTTVTNVQSRFIYMNDGYLKVYSVRFEETMYFDNIALFLLVLFVIVLDLGIYGYHLYRKSGKRIQNGTKYTVLGLIGITALACMPVLTDYLINTQDFDFHIVRIEGIKDAILCGQFPVRIQPTWFDGYGYACSIFYGEALLYIPAFLRILGVPVQTCYQIFQIMVNVMTCLIAYWSMKKMTKSQYAALFGTLIYMLSPYRLEDLYFRNAVGEATAMIFLPLVIYGMWRILKEEEPGESRRNIWLPLALGMTGLIQTHILTCEMVALLLVITCVIFVKRLLIHKKILTLLKAAGATVLLNAWFLVPFLDYFRGSYKVTMQEPTYIQKTGAFLSQIFMIFVDFESSYGSASTSEGMGAEMPLTIGIAFGFIIVFALAIIWTRGVKKNRDLKAGLICTALGILSIWMATNVFPWDPISNLGSIPAKLVSTIQFTWRFLAPATALLVFAAAIVASYCLKNVRPERITAVMALIGTMGVLSGVLFMNIWVDDVGPYRIYDTNKMNINYASSNSEYIPDGTNLSICRAKHDITGTDDLEVIDYTIEGTNITVQVSNMGPETELEIPLLSYPGYAAFSSETGEKIILGETDNHTITAVVPEEFAGTIQIQFVGKWFWRVAEIISLLSVLAWGIWMFLLLRKKDVAPR